MNWLEFSSPADSPRVMRAAASVHARSGGWPQPATASANSAPSSKNAGLSGPYSSLLRLRKESLRTLMIVICNKPGGKLMYGGGLGQARSEVYVRQIKSWAVRGGSA